MLRHTEALVASPLPGAGCHAQDGQSPFVYRIVPVWGDLDPARIVYTGRFTDYAIRAIDAWFLDRVGADFYTMNFEWGIGTPFVHTACDLRNSLTPRDILIVAVRVERIGSTSLTFRVDGRVESDRRSCFEGRFVCVCVVAAQQSLEPRAIPLDSRIRAAAEADHAIHSASDRASIPPAGSTTTWRCQSGHRAQTHASLEEERHDDVWTVHCLDTAERPL